MPPSLRRRVDHAQSIPQFAHGPSDDDEPAGDEELDEDEALPDDLADVDVDEEDLEEEEEQVASPAQSTTPFSAPIPANFREISGLASWTVSSSKPGCSIPQLRSPSTALFWQSDGPQPHYLNIHFFKLVRIVGLRLYLDFEADESYTPTRIIFLAGSGMNDLVEWAEMRLEQPRGWVWVDFEGVGECSSDEDQSDNDDDDDDDDDNEGAHLSRHSSPSISGTISEFEPSQHRGTITTGPSQPDPMLIDTPTLHPDPQTSPATLQHTPSMPPPRRDRRQNNPHTPQPPQARQHPLSPPPIHLAFPPPFPRPDQQVTPQTHQPQAPHRQPNLSPSSPPVGTPSLYPPPTHQSQHSHHHSPNPTSMPQRKKHPKKKFPVLRAHLVQVKILENHQNGKDTHLRGLQIFARDDEGRKEKMRGVGLNGMRGVDVGQKLRVSMGGEGEGDDGEESVRRAGGRIMKGRGDTGLGMGIGGGLGRPSWDVDPVLR